jgi:hypothetical protein
MPDVLAAIVAGDGLVVPDLAAHDLVRVASDDPYITLWAVRDGS